MREARTRRSAASVAKPGLEQPEVVISEYRSEVQQGIKGKLGRPRAPNSNGLVLHYVGIDSPPEIW